MSDEDRPPDAPLQTGGDHQRAHYAADEQERLRAEWSTSGAARCPQCDVAMNHRTIGGGSFGLGYARRRVWLLCPRCRRSMMFDVARGTRN